jgi:uncharacterized protein (DUF488 family)
MGNSPSIWTIGHSNHPVDALIGLLEAERIEVVADVRSFPFSRFAPHFNRDDLEGALGDADLRYLFLGEELGGRPSRPEHYDADGHALYGAMAREPGFRRAIARLLRGAENHRVALLCSEGRPQDCHRRLLVGKVLTERGITLRHILPDASLLIEQEVSLDAGDTQAALFDDGAPAWRSTQSVSHRRRLSASSAA